MHDKIVTIKNLAHRYSKHWAVKDISFHIEKGGVVGLLGSNGAGKSTTMNILCGLIKPTGGKVLVKGLNIREDALAVKKLIGFLPQKAPLYRDLTVDEYLSYSASFRLVPKNKIKQQVDRAKEFCGLVEYSKRLIKNLSGGYQQRVGIAQAIIHEPELVVLDEPTTGLDPVQINEVRNLIKTISSTSTVLLSTHVLSEVKAMCHDIVMIEKGNMVFQGSINEFNNQIKPNLLHVKAENPPSQEVLRKIQGVTKIHPEYNGTLKLEVDLQQNVAKALIAKSVEENWQLEEIYYEKVSLDNVFAKLSNRELKQVND